MARRCQLSGKAPTFGHNVSHSNVKTNRRFNPNLQKVTLYSEGLRRQVPLRICTRTLRSVQKLGGLDSFLLKMDDARLAPEGQRLKRQLKRALGPRPGARAAAGADAGASAPS